MKPMYPKMSGERMGVCNICGCDSILTEDHVPPKGCLVSNDKKISHALLAITKDDAFKKNHRSTRSQNGVKYRTICRACNNDLLGGNLDREIISFSQQVRLTFQSRIIMADRGLVQFEANNLLRCVAGHLAAQGVGKQGQGIRRREWTDYIMGNKSSFPQDSKFYFTPYPFTQQSIITNRGLVNISTNETIIYSMMQFFPVSFIVCETEINPAISYVDGVHNITPTSPFDKKCLSFNWSKMLNPRLLLAPGPNEIIMASLNDGVIAN